MKQGIPVVISAPSGGGKSTLVAHVLGKWSLGVRSISCTTRPPRSLERNGRDYIFISEKEFESRIKRNDFLEWAKVHGHYYGTPLSAFNRELSKGRDVVLTIDPQGAVSVRKKFPSGVYIFVTPSSWPVLLKRLKNRGTDTASSLKVRLKNAKRELKTAHHYDYLVLNEDLNSAVKDILAILKAEHRRVSRVPFSRIPIFQKNGQH